MNEHFRHIGDLLRAKREEQQLSLKEAESATSIRSFYLEAIEDGKLGQYVSSVYAIGFMRQYGSFLGIDVEKMMREQPAAFRLPGEKHEFSFGIGTLESRGSAGGGVRWLPNLLWAGGAALLLFVVWWLCHRLGVL